MYDSLKRIAVLSIENLLIFGNFYSGIISDLIIVV